MECSWQEILAKRRADFQSLWCSSTTVKPLEFVREDPNSYAIRENCLGTYVFQSHMCSSMIFWILKDLVLNFNMFYHS